MLLIFCEYKKTEGQKLLTEYAAIGQSKEALTVFPLTISSRVSAKWNPAFCLSGLGEEYACFRSSIIWSFTFLKTNAQTLCHSYFPSNKSDWAQTLLSPLKHSIDLPNHAQCYFVGGKCWRRLVC